MSALLKILAALRTGTSTASELSQPTDDYADLVARLQSMCFGGCWGTPSAWAWEGVPPRRSSAPPAQALSAALSRPALRSTTSTWTWGPSPASRRLPTQ